MKSASCLLLSLVLSVIVGCKPDVPSKYLQPDELENILYDYHVADAMAAGVSVADGEQAYAYRLAVLKKYGVTQAEFDSSMIFYTRNTALLRGVYEKISSRLEADEMALGGSGGGQYANLSATGDTAEIWTDDRSMVLTNKIPYNLYSYELRADTAFHKGDRFVLDFDTQFLFQDGIRDAVVVLAITLGNDSVVSQTQHVSSSMHYSMQVADTELLGIKAVRGYFLLNNETAFGGSLTTLRLLPIYNIHLIRMHQKSGDVKPAFSVPADSLHIDSTRNLPQPVEVQPVESSVQKVVGQRSQAQSFIKPNFRSSKC